LVAENENNYLCGDYLISETVFDDCLLSICTTANKKQYAALVALLNLNHNDIQFATASEISGYS
jgi:hypothetical protein